MTAAPLPRGERSSKGCYGQPWTYAPRNLEIPPRAMPRSRSRAIALDATSSTDAGAPYTSDFGEPPALTGHHVSWCGPLDMR